VKTPSGEIDETYGGEEGKFYGMSVGAH